MHRFFNTNFKEKFANSYATTLLTAASFGVFAFFVARSSRISGYNNYYRDGVEQGIKDATQHKYDPPDSSASTNINTLPIIAAASLFAATLFLRSIFAPGPQDTAGRYTVRCVLFCASFFFGLYNLVNSAEADPGSPYSKGYDLGYQSHCNPNSDPSCTGGISDPYSGLMDSPAKWPLILTGILTFISLNLMIEAIYLRKKMIAKNVDSRVTNNSIENPEARPFAHSNEQELSAMGPGR